MAVISRVMKGFRPSRPDVPAIPDGLWSVVNNCWAHDPKSRPHMGEVVKDLGSQSFGT